MNFRYSWVTYRDGVRDGRGSIILRNQISRQHATREAAERLKRTGLWRPRTEVLAGELLTLPDEIPKHVAGMVAALRCHVGLAVLPFLMPLVKAHPFICLFMGAVCLTALFFMLLFIMGQIMSVGVIDAEEQRLWDDLEVNPECNWWVNAWQKALYVHARRRMNDHERARLHRILARYTQARRRAVHHHLTLNLTDES